MWSVDGERGIVGVEALLRWQHPDHGLLRPDAFINTAEQSLAGDELSTWILREVCRQAHAWSGRGSPPIGVNVSHQQILAPGYAGRFAELISELGLRADRFMFELTESAWTVDAAAVHGASRTCAPSAPRSPWTISAPATRRCPACASWTST